MLYSPGTKGFYDRDIHGDAVPSDAVEITDERHAELMQGQAEGLLIGSDADGAPILQQRPADELRAGLILAIKAQAGFRIEAISPLWRQMNDQRLPTTAGAERFAAIDAIRAASDQIEAALAETSDADLSGFPVAGHPLWPA